ncbi:MAG: glycogen phosphorylase, partial [Verrucomicrobiota bacterium]|nr:glycogen phosphorylase [Verrucomicrobiota bacterium]
MHPVQTFNISPRLPEKLEPLRELAHNRWWTWEPDARRLFRHLDTQLWDRTNHNPIRMLQLSRQARLIELADDDDYIREMQAIFQKFKAYIARTDTYGKLRSTAPKIAYFSA